MKAVILTRYGPPESLEYRDTDEPTPKSGEVRLEVHASAINDWEWGLMRGRPLFMRFFLGLFRPRVQIMGCDVAGTIEAVGSNVVEFEPGDDVYDDLSDSGFGAFAESVCVPERALRRKPFNLTFEEAATVPHAAGLALQGLRDLGQLQDGQSLLINGAGGGVGALAIQYARLFDVEVTGVDSAFKLEFMRSLGCDHVIDYEEEDFTQSERRYDLILDTKTNRSPLAYARALSPGGTYVTVGGSMFRMVQILLVARWFARMRNKQMRILSLQPNTGLSEMTRLLEARKILPSIGDRYPLKEAPRALRAFEESRHTGRIVITVP